MVVSCVKIFPFDICRKLLMCGFLTALRDGKSEFDFNNTLIVKAEGEKTLTTKG
jgi:hypothetical protein